MMIRTRKNINNYVGYQVGRAAKDFGPIVSLLHWKQLQRMWVLGCHQERSLSVESSARSSPSSDQGRKIQSENARLFQNHPALKRARIKRELKPLLSLAVHQILQQKQNQEWMSGDLLRSAAKQDFKESVELLARWNGYAYVNPEHVVVTPDDKGRIPLGRGLIAEASPFASENYIILARKRRQEDQNHPDFIVQDFSWYRALEKRINDALDRWEERARDRRQKRRETAKEQLQRSLDAVQAPAADLFVAVTARLSPFVDFIRRSIRWNKAEIKALANSEPENQNQTESEEDRSSQEMHVESTPGRLSTRNSRIPTEALMSDYHLPELSEGTDHVWSKNDEERYFWNKTDPEDLIILARDETGTTLMLLEDVHPTNRLLALPDSTSFFDSTAKKIKPAYRLRLAGGGLIITCSLVMLGTIPPAYRSLRFILEYPRTAEIIMISLVGSVAYSLWSWASSSKIEQERLISAALNSRLIARNEAAVAYLAEGAVDNLTHIIMEEYVSRLVASGGQDVSTDNVDPLVMEIALSVGLFESRWLMDGEEEAVAAKWGKARSALVNMIAGPAHSIK